MDQYESELSSELEAAGETKVRDNLLRGLYGSNRRNRKLQIIQSWLHHKESIRLEAELARTESREERSILIAESAVGENKIANSISQQALDGARTDRRWTIVLAVIALGSVITQVFDYFKDKKP